MKVLVLTSGGDAPGMNTVLGSLYKKLKGKLYACRGGYKGLINNDILCMKEYKPHKFIKQSGSVIKCKRCIEFQEEVHFAKAVKNANRFDFVVIIGGEGSLAGAEKLAKAGINVVFIPATIDNDVKGSEYSLGYHTGVKAGVETFRNIMPSIDACESCMIIEVMGNQSGKLVEGITQIVNPTFTITSSEEINYDEIVKNLCLNKEKGEASSIIIKDKIVKLNEFIENLTQKVPHIAVRGIKIGYIQRGHKPTKREILIAKDFTNKAISAIKKGISGKLFMQNGKINLLSWNF